MSQMFPVVELIEAFEKPRPICLRLDLLDDSQLPIGATPEYMAGFYIVGGFDLLWLPIIFNIGLRTAG